MKILGVDLGSYSVKIAEVEASAKGYTLTNYFEIPLSGEPYRDRNLQIIEAVREISSRYEAGTTKWVIAVPQHRLSVHFKRFPFRERPKIQKSLAFELEDEIPLDVDDAIFDFKVVEYVGPSTDVLTVACPKDAVEEILNLSKDCGFDPEIVSVESFALNNHFQSWNSAPAEVSPALRAPVDGGETAAGALTAGNSFAKIAVHIGHSRTLLLVYRDGALIATRSILWGGADIAAEIARSFNISLFESMKVLTDRGFILMNSAGATTDQMRLSQAVSSQVDFLIKDLKLTLLELKAEFRLDFTEVAISGGTSQVQNLGAYLTQGLELPVNLNNRMLSAVPTRMEITPQMEASAAVAIGLAIEAVKRPRNPAVNLRREDFARENLTLKRFWETWRVPAQVALSAFAVFFIYAVVRDQVAGSMLTAADDKMVEAGQKAANLKGSTSNESSIRKYIKTQKTILANQKAFGQLDAYVSAMDILSRLSEKFPPKVGAGQGGVDVSYFEIENDEVTIKGKAANASVTAGIEKVLNEMAQPKSFATVPGDAGGFGFKLKINRKD
jgi:general secretion pathway protein L